MNGWMLFHLVTSGLAVVLTAAFFLLHKPRSCGDNLAFAAALLMVGILSDVAYAYRWLGPVCDMLDALIGAAAAIVWLYRGRPLWDWRVALALTELFTMGFHAAFRAGVYQGEAALIGYQWRLGFLALAARACVVAGPTKTIVQWVGDRWFPAPGRPVRADPAPAPARRATWP